MKKSINNYTILKEIIFSTFKEVPLSCTIVTLCTIMSALMPIILTWSSIGLFNNAEATILGENEFSSLLFYAIIYLLVYFLMDQISHLQIVATNKRLYEYRNSLCDLALAKKTSKLPLIDFEDENKETSRRRAQDCIEQKIIPQLFMETMGLISRIIGITGVVFILAQYSWLFIPISLISVLPYLIMRIKRGREFYELKYKQAKGERKLAYLWSLFNNKQTVKEMRVMGFDSYITDQWKSNRDSINEELWDHEIKDKRSMLFCDIIRIAGYSLSFLLSLILTLNKQLAIGVFGACISGFTAIQNQTMELFVSLGKFPEMLLFAKQYYQFLDLEEETEKSNVKHFEKFENISVKGMSFKYPCTEKYALKNISFEIKKGERIAILGENGSGKTTLSKCLMGLYNLNEGEIIYNDIPLESWSRTSLYDHVTMVSQTVIPYYFTVREDVSMSDITKKNDDVKIQNVLQEVGLEELIGTNEGLDTKLGKEFDGIELSGGQWQKLALARSLLKDSQFVILDEPTSALDPLIETEILHKFMQTTQNKTAIFISHRVGLCKFVDKIIVMKDGYIAEIGSHDELISKNGEYSRLYTMQQKWYK